MLTRKKTTLLVCVDLIRATCNKKDKDAMTAKNIQRTYHVITRDAFVVLVNGNALPRHR